MSEGSRRIKELFADIQEALEDEIPSACPPCQTLDHLFCTKPDLNNDQQCYHCCCVALSKDVPSVSNTGGFKDAADITDVQSTGRKRAAQMYPISEGMICEWSYLKFAGGGVLPISGCLDNKATNIHHGPDKNTLNNTSVNVHRICSFCHNYWHGQNDKYYGVRPAGTEPFIPIGDASWSLPDAKTRSTMEEILTDQVKRKMK